MGHKTISTTLAAFAAMVLICCAMFSSALAQTLSYQGVLKTTEGNVTAGTRLLTVTLYGDANGNTTIWQTKMNTPVDANGVFNLMLGSAENPLPAPSAMDRPIWLGIAVDNGTEMRPLSQITVSAFAINVADNAITTAKLADNAVTASKLNTDYVSSISVNGQKVTGQASNLNIIGGDGVNLVYDDASKSLLLNTSGSATNTDGKGANAESLGDSWIQGGNNLVSPYPEHNFLGTLDTTSLWIRVYAYTNSPLYGTAMRYTQPYSQSIPDIIGGYYGSFVFESGDTTKERGGNVIAGGGDAGDENYIYYSHFGTISGGLGNRISDPSDNIYGWTDQFKFQVVGGGEKNHVLEDYSSVLGGKYNKALGVGSSIGGGYSNQTKMYASWSTIAGGDSNVILDTVSFVGGGFANEITNGNFSVIGGGIHNSISDSISTIGGGQNNSITDIHSSILGGLANSSSGPGYSAIGGGRYNKNYGAYGVIAGGDTNSIDVGETHSNYDAIGGGLNNSIMSSDTAAIAGGAHNIISTAKSGFIGGGTSNTILLSQGGVIGGGDTNFIGAVSGESSFGFIGGGQRNWIKAGRTSVIAGGDTNLVDGDANSITGGGRNTTTSSYSHIGGGDTNFIIDFPYSVIGGGEQNHIFQPDTIVGDHSFIGGGYQNTIKNGMGAIGGGNNNMIDTFADHSFIGGGRQNIIQGPFSVIAGGDSNSINNQWADHNFIGGGFGNVENNPSFGAIGSGLYNLLDTDAWGSGILSGTFDTVYTQLGFIGGGRFNSEDNTSDFGSGIGTGERNHTNANLSFIGGGQLNQVLADFADIGGGQDNIIMSGASHAVIPGGDSLIANSFAQTVVGYNNIETGTITEGTHHAGIDTALFIVGNGDKSTATARSDAFTVSYNGHSSAYQSLGATAGTPARMGSTYANNTIVAWGNVAGGASSTVDDIGVGLVTHVPLSGTYTITLNVVNQDGTAHVFTTGDAAITVSLGPGPSSAAGMITVTQLSTALPGTTTIPVFVVNTFNAGGTASDNYGFQFHVVAR